MIERGDRVTLGTENGVVYGTVMSVATDGETRVKIDGQNGPGMWYPVGAVQKVEVDTDDDFGYPVLSLVNKEV